MSLLGLATLDLCEEHEVFLWVQHNRSVLGGEEGGAGIICYFCHDAANTPPIASLLFPVFFYRLYAFLRQRGVIADWPPPTPLS